MEIKFSSDLQSKIDSGLLKRKEIQLGEIKFDSKLLLAPMSAICNSPFRLLMEMLGAGGTVSELISCHGINYKNKKTVDMLRIHPREKNVGIQLFGEDAEAMATAAKVAESFGPKFIDINMGCPVRKVVSKGGGSALLQDPTKLGHFFKTIKSAIDIPLTIKIRTGWDSDSINAHEVVHIAQNEGIEFVSVHGRTRAQAYTGEANWDYLEKLAEDAPLPIIGNGDLHLPSTVYKRNHNSNCHALMLGRGPLRLPFIFLEGLDLGQRFEAIDYAEVLEVYFKLLCDYTDHDRIRMIQLRKMAVWFSAGFDGASYFRQSAFKTEGIDELLSVINQFFNRLTETGKGLKRLDISSPFMAGGHG